MDKGTEVEAEDWTIMDLPREVLHMLLSYLSFKDLMKCRRVCSGLLNVIDNDKKLLADARLELVYPTRRNHSHFMMAAQAGNFGAKVMLAATYIYDGAQPEPLGFDFKKRWQEADKLFEEIDDRLAPSTPPISWIFYRPPYRSFRECCKINIFREIGIKATVQRVQQEKRQFKCRDLYIISRILVLMPDRCPAAHVKTYLKRIVKKNGCPHASFLLLGIESEECNYIKLDKARQLRQILAKCPQSYDAQRALCYEYANSQYGCHTEDMANTYTHKIFSESICGFRYYSQATSNKSFEKNRLVVVSWMMEVAEEHCLRANVLHSAIDIFDRFMSRQPVDSCQLQLVGITALAISTRLLDIVPLTITWAAWLTDNTYHYMDVVRMKGCMVATLNGRLQTWKALDYLTLLIQKSGCHLVMNFMVRYLLETAHLVLDLRYRPQAEVAAACFQLASVILILPDESWPVKLQKWTGFSREFVAKTTMILYKNIFMMKRGKLATEAWKIARNKYACDEFMCVSTVYWRTPHFYEICQLGHSEDKQLELTKGAVGHFCCAAAKYKATQPSRKRRRLREKKIYELVNANDNEVQHDHAVI